MTYPIILAHGIAPFDRLLRDAMHDDDSSDDATHYFRRIRSMLEGPDFDIATDLAQRFPTA